MSVLVPISSNSEMVRVKYFGLRIITLESEITIGIWGLPELCVADVAIRAIALAAALKFPIPWHSVSLDI